MDNLNEDSPADCDEVETNISEEPFHPLSPSSEFLPKIQQTLNGELKSTTNSNVVRGKHFTSKDLQNIQIAINEFIAKALLPYIERQAKVMHESILNRRGMSKSFFSATKRLFGGGTGAKNASIVYSSDSLEMSCRKLADLYFLFGHYSGAYQFYHQLKKDFQADSAWIYYASALEMVALSHFMMTQAEPPMAVTRSFPVHYITEAITNYIDFCRMPDAATRCAIICCECLKQVRGNFGEAAAIFIRMTSEDCDLRSALMLEQAAYSFLRLSSPRKYALHSVLAGHRYAKAGLRTHSLNCYLQACQIYAGRGWRFAEDHVHSTITRHLTCLQIYAGLSAKFLSSLKTPTYQPVAQVQSIPVSQSISPAQSPLKLEHSCLKRLSTQTAVNLLRVQNVTKDKTITVKDMIFEPPHVVAIDNVTWGPSGIQKNSLTLQLEPAQSCNIIFHTRALGVLDNNEISETQQNFLKLSVKWQVMKTVDGNMDNNTEDSKLSGFHHVVVSKADILSSSTSDSIVFQLRHVSRRVHDFYQVPCFVCPVELILSHHQKPGKLILKIEKDAKRSPEYGEKIYNFEQVDTKNSLSSSSQAVFFVGKTSWILDNNDAVDGQKLTYNVAVTRPGIYNVAPSLSVKRPDDGTQQIYDLHSPFIIDQA